MDEPEQVPSIHHIRNTTEVNTGNPQPLNTVTRTWECIMPVSHQMKQRKVKPINKHTTRMANSAPTLSTGRKAQYHWLQASGRERLVLDSKSVSR
jgi:hypothetical protein